MYILLSTCLEGLYSDIHIGTSLMSYYNYFISVNFLRTYFYFLLRFTSGHLVVEAFVIKIDILCFSWFYCGVDCPSPTGRQGGRINQKAAKVVVDIPDWEQMKDAFTTTMLRIWYIVFDNILCGH